VARRSIARRRIFRASLKYAWQVTPRRFKRTEAVRHQDLENALIRMDTLEKTTFSELEEKGVPTDQWVYYVAFSKRAYDICWTFTGDTRAQEIDSLINEYVLRGYDEDVLAQLAAAACTQADQDKGRGPPPPPPPPAQSVKVFKTGIAHGNGHFPMCYHYFTQQADSSALFWLYVANEGVSGFAAWFFGVPMWSFGICFQGGHVWNEYPGGDDIGTYPLNQWVKIMVAWYSAAGNFDVWVNDEYRGNYNFVNPYFNAINAICFQAGGDEITAQASYWDDVKIPQDTGALLSEDFQSGTPPEDPPGWTVSEDTQCRVELSQEQGH